MNKRLKILIVIAIILALVNLGITIKNGLESLKKPAAISADAQPVTALLAASAISRIRGEEASNSRFVRPDNNKVMLTLYDIKCKYCKLEDVDFSEKVILDSVLESGELLKQMDRIRLSPGHPEYSYYFVKKKSDGKTALIKSDYGRGFNPLHICDIKGLNELFGQLKKDDIMFSMFFNKSRYDKRDEYAASLHELIKGKRNTIPDDHAYNIFIKPQSPLADSLFQIDGENLKILLKYYFQRRDIELYESIVWNDEIPQQMKKKVSEDYILSWFHYHGDDANDKDIYLSFIWKMISEGSNTIAQSAQEYAFNKYLYDQILDDEDVIELSNKVIALNKSPKSVLLAYSIKTYCYLQMKEPYQARIFAIEALDLYEKLYYSNMLSGYEILNFQAAASCLAYMMINGNDPVKILKYIESFENPDNKTEFANYLLNTKAVLIELTDGTIEETNAAYEKVHFDPQTKFNIRGLGDYKRSFEVYHYIDGSKNFLNYRVDETMTMNKPFKAKKFLLSEEFIMMNKSGSMKINIIQKFRSSSASSFSGDGQYFWYKAKIANEIYWIESTQKKPLCI